MTSVRKRKMNRSSIRKNTRRVKDKQRDINIYSNPIIAANWDKNLTLSQNYKKLNLRSKLGGFAGGQEKEVLTLSQRQELKKLNERPSISSIEDTQDPSQIPEGEARLIRDPDTNEVIKVIYGTMKQKKVTQEQVTSSVIEELEKCARKNAAIKKERVQSDREVEWLKSLYEKHGDNYDKMFWDKKLNVNQQSIGDIKKRIIKWKAANNIS